MIPLVFVAALLILALVTQAGVMVLQRAYPAQGKMIEVSGATLNVVELGPRDAPGPAIVLIHGASSNLRAMQQPLGDGLAGKHRVILIDRPGHGWSTRAREDDSTPAIQGRMINAALEKLGVGPAIFVVHSWAGALGARMALDYPTRVAGLVMLAPVAYPWSGGVGWYNGVVTIPVIGPLLAYTITLPLGLYLTESGARTAFLPQIMPENFVRDTATPLLLRPREFPRQCPRSRNIEGGGEGAGLALRRNQGADRGDRRRRRHHRVADDPLPALRRCGAERETNHIAWCRSHRAKRRARACDARDRCHDRRNRACNGGRRQLGRFRAQACSRSRRGVDAVRVKKRVKTKN
jgi:pimeloyl-ACP methyl ester carboxylesterase